MFEFVRRLLGGRGPAPALDAGSVAAVTVLGRGSDAAPFNPASLDAADAAGTRLLACTVAIDPFPPRGEQLAQRGAGTAGNYQIDAVLPARPDPVGQALFGPNPSLRLRAIAYGVTDPSRPDTLLIHGGPAGRPTDGSIRMQDADLARLLALLPDDPRQVSVRLVKDAEGDRLHPRAVDRDDTWDEDWEDSAIYYAQMHDWTEPPDGSPPYPDLPFRTEQDQAVAASLAGLGYDVLPGSAAAAVAPSDAAGEGAGTASDWSPTGGAYGR